MGFSGINSLKVNFKKLTPPLSLYLLTQLEVKSLVQLGWTVISKLKINAGCAHFSLSCGSNFLPGKTVLVKNILVGRLLFSPPCPSTWITGLCRVRYSAKQEVSLFQYEVYITVPVKFGLSEPRFRPLTGKLLQRLAFMKYYISKHL